MGVKPMISLAAQQVGFQSPQVVAMAEALRAIPALPLHSFPPLLQDNLVHSHFVPHAKREVTTPEHLSRGGLQVQDVQLGDDCAHQIFAELLFCHDVASVGSRSP
jgi:hypothetical protein